MQSLPPESDPPIEEPFDEEDDSEPLLKYQYIQTDFLDRVSDQSDIERATCMTVGCKYLMVGTSKGKLHITDFQGNPIKTIRFSPFPLTDLSVSEHDYVGVATNDGHVYVLNIFDEEIIKFSYDRPILTVALHPLYSDSNKKFVLGGKQKRLLCVSKGRFRSNQNEISAGDGDIFCCRWRGSLLAWANDSGVHVYDFDREAMLATLPLFSEANGAVKQQYMCNLCWCDDRELLIGWADCIILYRVFPQPDENGRFGRTIYELTHLPYIVLGVAPFNGLYAVLSTDHDNQNPPEPPALRLLSLEIPADTPPDEWNPELTVDMLDMLPIDPSLTKYYRLEANPVEMRLYMLSPKDIIEVTPIEMDDHICWLLSQGRYAEALTDAQKCPSELKTLTISTIVERYINTLLEEQEYTRAVELADEYMADNPDSYERILRTLMNKGKLDVVPEIPIERPRMSQQIYESVLSVFMVEDPARFHRCVESWMHLELFDPAVIIEQTHEVTKLVDELARIRDVQGRLEDRLVQLNRITNGNIQSIHSIQKSILDEEALLQERYLEVRSELARLHKLQQRYLLRLQQHTEPQPTSTTAHTTETHTCTDPPPPQASLSQLLGEDAMPSPVQQGELPPPYHDEPPLCHEGKEPRDTAADDDLDEDQRLFLLENLPALTHPHTHTHTHTHTHPSTHTPHLRATAQRLAQATCSSVSPATKAGRCFSEVPEPGSLPYPRGPGQVSAMVAKYAPALLPLLRSKIDELQQERDFIHRVAQRIGLFWELFLQDPSSSQALHTFCTEVEPDVADALIARLVDAAAAFARRLFETKIALHRHSQEHEKAFLLLLQLQKSEVFTEIEAHPELHKLVLEQLPLLWRLDEEKTLALLTATDEVEQSAMPPRQRDFMRGRRDGMGSASRPVTIRVQVPRFPVHQVVEQLRDDPPLLCTYLHRIFLHDTNWGREYFNDQMALYADYQPEHLLNFLSRAVGYDQIRARQICEERKFYRELVLVLVQMGATGEALHILILRLRDVEMAIQLCDETGDPKLFDQLRKLCLDPKYLPAMALQPCESTLASEFTRRLAKRIGPLELMKSVPEHRIVPGLKESVIIALKEHNLQRSIIEVSARAQHHDTVSLTGRLVEARCRGVQIPRFSRCEVCDAPLSIQPHHLLDPSDLPPHTPHSAHPPTHPSPHAAPQTRGRLGRAPNAPPPRGTGRGARMRGGRQGLPPGVVVFFCGHAYHEVCLAKKIREHQAMKQERRMIRGKTAGSSAGEAGKHGGLYCTRCQKE